MTERERGGELRLPILARDRDERFALAPATFGVAVAFAMIQPRLVDLGFGLTSIGTIVAAIHLLAFSLIGPITGSVARRVSPLSAIVAGGLLLAPGFLVLTFADRLLGPGASAIAAVLFVIWREQRLGLDRTEERRAEGPPAGGPTV